MEGVRGLDDELAEMMAAGERVDVVARRERLDSRCSSSTSTS
jgi:hypothetical protein